MGLASMDGDLPQSYFEKTEIPFFNLAPYDDCESEQWQDFKVFSYWQPCFILKFTAESLTIHTTLIFKNNLHLDLEEIFKEEIKLKTKEVLNLLNTPKVPENIRFQWDQITETPNQLEWEKSFKLIDFQILKKVVLTRKKTFSQKFCAKNSFSKNVLWKIFCEFHRKNLNLKSNEDKPKLFFYFSPTPQKSFFGLTPEKLFTLNFNEITLEALAGTRPRDLINPEQDQIYINELLNSPKENFEHELVCLDIIEHMTKLTCLPKLKIKPIFSKKILTLKNVHHLYTLFQNTLNINWNSHYPHLKNTFEIYQIFHPTAAIGGYPHDLGYEWTCQHRHFSRGLYSGAQGFIDPKNKFVEYWVGIRSALTELNVDHVFHLNIFGGAGIMPLSRPGSEWEEIENKMKPIIETFSDSFSETH
jgi:isochorismate synthase EntC